MQSTSPLVFLGLDGLPWSLARELSVQGLLPNLTRVMDTSGPIRAELPELSPVNWTSLFTASPLLLHHVQLCFQQGLHAIFQRRLSNYRGFPLFLFLFP